MKIIWSPLSLQRIQEISDYIALDNISSANNWIDIIFGKVDILKSNPEIGRIVPEIVKKIAILTIRHFKQILPTEEIMH